MKTRERRLSTNTWILAAFLAALGAYSYLVEVRGGERQEQAQQRITHLLPFPSDAATELDIERPGERIVCRKQAGQWRIVAPVRTDADDTTINRILSDMAESKVNRTVTAHPTDLSTFGLSHPLLLTVASGTTRQTIRVGKENPTGSFVFAQRVTEPAFPHVSSSQAVLVVDQRIRDAAEKKLYDLREKTILDFSPDDVTALTYVDGGRTIRMVRQPGIQDDPQPGDVDEALRIDVVAEALELRDRQFAPASERAVDLSAGGELVDRAAGAGAGGSRRGGTLAQPGLLAARRAVRQ